MRKKKTREETTLYKKKRWKVTSSNHFKLDGNFKVDLFLFCTNGSFQLRNVYLKVL